MIDGKTAIVLFWNLHTHLFVSHSLLPCVMNNDTEYTDTERL